MEEKHDWHVFIVNARDSALYHTGDRGRALLSTLAGRIFSATFSFAVCFALRSSCPRVRQRASDATSHVTPRSLARSYTYDT